MKRHFPSLCKLLLLSLVLPLSGSTDEPVLRNERFQVELDADFPRVRRYQAGALTLSGTCGQRPAIEMNAETYSPADFRVQSAFETNRATYRVSFPAQALELEFQFKLEGSDLIFRLTKVEERGPFQLRTLYFPDHCLARVDTVEPGASMYRIESSRTHAGPLVSKPADAGPVRANWVVAYKNGMAATLRNNIAYYKVNSQLHGPGATARSFGLWNGVYSYRLRGQVRERLESRVGILTADRNQDGAVDWQEAALWHRAFFPPLNAVYRDAFVTKMICTWVPPDNQPILRFDDVLEVIKRVCQITGGARHVSYLVGWQHAGHDTGYPSMDQVYEKLGSKERLLNLVREAKKFNTLVSYHANLDDAYAENPRWNPAMVALKPDGTPRPGPVYIQPGPQAYRIVHVKEVESGYFQERAQSFLDAVPVEKTVHFDTFSYNNSSYEPDGREIGVEEEIQLGVNAIADWFNQRGIDISSESSPDGFFGRQSFFWLWIPGSKDPFILLMMHDRALGGGKGPAPLGEILGWSPNMGFAPIPIPQRGQIFRRENTLADLADSYYVGVLLQHFLRKKDLVFLGPDGGDYVARFDDGTVSRWSTTKPVSPLYRGVMGIAPPGEGAETGTLRVTNGDVVFARGYDRFIPVSDSEIRLYSVSGGPREWKLPAGWADARLSLTALSFNGSCPVRDIEIKDGSVRLTMDPRRPYVLRKE